MQAEIVSILPSEPALDSPGLHPASNLQNRFYFSFQVSGVRCQV
jgi:hypothetical protein